MAAIEVFVGGGFAGQAGFAGDVTAADLALFDLCGDRLAIADGLVFLGEGQAALVACGALFAKVADVAGWGATFDAFKPSDRAAVEIEFAIELLFAKSACWLVSAGSAAVTASFEQHADIT